MTLSNYRFKGSNLGTYFGAFVIFTSQLQTMPQIWVTQEPKAFGEKKVQYEISGKIEVTAFTPWDIKPLVKDNPEALKAVILADDYDTYWKIWFWAAYLPGLASLVSATLTTQTNSELSVGLFAAGFVLGFAGLIGITSNQRISEHYLFKSINIYNGMPAERSASVMEQEINRRATISFSHAF